MKFNAIVKGLKSGKDMEKVKLAVRIEVVDNMKWLPGECYDAFSYEDDTEDIRENIWDALQDDCMNYLKKEVSNQDIQNEGDLHDFIREGLCEVAKDYINR